MNLRHLNLRRLLRLSNLSSTASTTTTLLTFPPLLIQPHLKPFHSSAPLLNLSLASTSSSASSPASYVEESDSDAAMNEFLSRFVHSMRSKLVDAYPHSDKPTIDSMLLLIVQKLLKQMDANAALGGGRGGFMNSPLSAISDDLGNEELNRIMLEVSNAVFLEMEREKKKEKMKMYLQSEQVKELTRIASQVGVRGEMLRELRFKWARQVMEEAEFYEELYKLNAKAVDGKNVAVDNDGDVAGVKEELLPKRHGRMKYKLYGLDLSGAEWAEVAEKVLEAEGVVFPKEAKEITGKCKVVTEKIVALEKEEDEGKVSELVKEWIDLLEPTRVDWIALLARIKERDHSAYLKMAERVLDEPSFHADIRDYTRLIDTHAKENRIEDVERLLKKMSEKGMPQDVITLTALLHMYSKSNNLQQAKEAFEALRNQGFKPDMEIYSSMMMAFINAGQPKSAEALLREMELRDIKPEEEIHLSLLRAFAHRGDHVGAQRILTTMQFAGFQPTVEAFTLLIEASAKSGNASDARNNFDYMMRLGHKPDDRSTSFMISAYEKRNELDKALSLLLQLEKEGFQPGVLTYSALVDWFGKLQLIDEAEQIVARIAQLGEAPPLKIQVSLCDMYARVGIEKKALQALGVLESKKDLLGREDFDRIIQGLLKGGFKNDAYRIQKLMEAQGFTISDSLNLSLMATKAFPGTGSSQRPGMR